MRNKDPKKKCSLCGRTNTEFRVIDVTPSGWWRRFFTCGKIRIMICQSCISKMMRKLVGMD